MFKIADRDCIILHNLQDIIVEGRDREDREISNWLPDRCQLSQSELPGPWGRGFPKTIAHGEIALNIT